MEIKNVSLRFNTKREKSDHALKNMEWKFVLREHKIYQESTFDNSSLPLTLLLHKWLVCAIAIQ